MNYSFLGWATPNSLANISESTIQFMLTVSAIGGVVVVLAMLLQTLLSRHVSAKWMYAFWILVVARFVLFVAPESPTSFLNLISQREVAQNTFAESSEVDFSYGTLSSTQPLEFLESEMLIASDLASPTYPSLNAWHAAFLLWMIGMVWAFTSLILGYCRVKKLIVNSVDPSEELLQLLEGQTQSSVAQNVKIRISHDLQVPATAGAFKPIILIPGWCDREMTELEMELVIAHELVHIRRRDGLIQLMSYIVSAIHWFNPLVRIAVRCVESTRELSCDQKVITTFEAESTAVKQIYGELILNIATRANKYKPTCAVFLGGFIGSNKCLIKQRIAMLIQSRSRRKFGTFVAAMAAAMVVAVGFTAAQSVVLPSTRQEDESLLVSPLEPLDQKSSQASKPVTKEKPTAEKYLNEIELISGRTFKFRACKSAPKFKVEDPTIADLVFVEDTGLELKGIRPGQTSFEIIEEDGEINEYKIHVASRPPVQVALGDSKKIEFPYRIPELLVPDPEAINVTAVSPTTMMITAKKYGNATVVVSNENRDQEIIECEVIANTKAIQKGIAKVFPDSQIKVDAFRGNVILKGVCKPAKAAKIIDWVKQQFEVTDVINQCVVDNPIAIKVKVYEVSTEKMKAMGIDWSTITKDKKTKKVNSIADVIAAASNKQKAAGQNMSFGIVEKPFAAFISALEKNAVVKLLDQPTLVANPGKPVEFLRGGEVPIAVLNENGKKSIEFRSFGTKINTTATPTGDEGLTLEVKAELSELAKDLVNEDGVPGFRVRRVNTGVQMKFGETLAMTGAYRVKGTDQEETEFLYLITPRKIKMVAQKNQPLIK